MATRKALVVGIDDYGGPPNDLPSCVADANAITQLLRTGYEFREIHTVRDGDATVANLEDELHWLASNPRPDDRLVFYFSGHGYTRLVNGVMEELLVLHDGFFEGNRLLTATEDLAPGTLTVILDACFSGGMEKMVFDPAGVTPDVEVAEVKVWKPSAEDAARDKDFLRGGQQTITELRRFGYAPITSPAAIARTLAVDASASRAAQSAPAGAAGTPWLLASPALAANGASQLELNGLLITACLETESAVASTSKTEGLSAFTHALVRAVERSGASATAADVLSATEVNLRALGVRQTPVALERAAPGNLRHRRFITLEPAGVADSLGILSESRFWESMLTAMVPQIHAMRAVLMKEGRDMSTMYQPAAAGYQGTVGGFQPGLGLGQPSPDDVQRMIPVLAPILATVIPAIVPPIINSLLAQQRAMPPWGGQGLGQFGGLGQPFGGLGQQFGGFGQQPGGWGQFGQGGPQSGQDLMQTISQSVHEALRRAGIQSPVLGGRF